MKSVLVMVSLVALTLISCTDVGVTNPGGTNKEVFIQVDSTVYKVQWVTVSSGGSGFYMMTKRGSKVTIGHDIPETIGFKEGKIETSIIKVD